MLPADKGLSVSRKPLHSIRLVEKQNIPLTVYQLSHESFLSGRKWVRLKVYAVPFIIVPLHHRFSSFSSCSIVSVTIFSVAYAALQRDRNIRYVVFSVANYIEDLQAVPLECDICWHYIAFPTTRWRHFIFTYI